MKMRGKMAEFLYKADLDITGSTVKEVVDLLEKVARYSYTKALVDQAIGNINEDIIETAEV